MIHNLICSKTVPEVIAERWGQSPCAPASGHSFIKQVMAETGAVFGGEHSGHYYFRDNFRADSGLIAAAVVMEQLANSGVPMSELRKPYERYSASGEVNSVVDDPEAVMAEVATRFAHGDQDQTDGLTVSFEDWWFNLRPSNTEPLLRLNLEASDEQSCRRHVDELLAIVRGG